MWLMPSLARAVGCSLLPSLGCSLLGPKMANSQINELDKTVSKVVCVCVCVYVVACMYTGGVGS